MKGFIFLGVFVYFIGTVFAISGVSPAGYEFDFESGLSRTCEFTFIFDEGVEVELYVEGSLKDYVTLDKESIVGREKVSAYLKLPESVYPPGVNIIRIGTREVGLGNSGIGAFADIGGEIRVNVPYPGKYVELEVSAPNYNIGEVMNISVKATNRGKVDLSISPFVQIFNGSEKIQNLETKDKRTIKPFESSNFYFSLDTSNYSFGEYNAVALADYGEEELSRDDDLFRLGHLNVEIINYTYRFERNKINPFDIRIKSEWNSPIEEIYADVFVLNNDYVSFRTSPIRLGSWKEGVLNGFIDTYSLKGEDFMANITLHYNNKTSSRIVALKLEKGFDFVPYLVGFIFIIVLVVLIWRVRRFFRKVKEHKS